MKVLKNTKFLELRDTKRQENVKLKIDQEILHLASADH